MILIVAAVLYFGGVFGGVREGDELDIDIDQPTEVIEVPDVELPDVEIQAPDIQVPDTIVID